MVMRKLYILMNNELVGELTQDNAGGLSFSYVADWISKPHSRPVSLSLPLVNQKFSGEVVYNFFDNLLPDNPQIRARIQARFQAKSSRPFDLLALIGSDCVGAIQIVERIPQTQRLSIESHVVSEAEIARTLRSYQTSPLGMDKEDDEFRISIAGAQEKTAFLYYQNEWHKPFGPTSTTHIFKLPIGYLPHQGIDLSESCENEHLCLLLASKFGLDVAKSKILQFEDEKVLVVERFDRKWSRDNRYILRLPQEDLCQALGYSPNLKYQSDGGPGIKEIMQLLNGSQQPQKDRDEFFRAQVVYWCLGAIDAHAKNFSISIQPQGGYQLTPLYDIISAYPIVEQKQLSFKKLKMAMALYGKNIHYKIDGIQKRHFIETAKYVKYSKIKAAQIFEQVIDRIDSAIDEVSRQLPNHFPEKIADPIFKGMRAFKERMIST
ncbi:TPA: type II toxin-antitoxin system HipA family toxin [Legionella pneumophila]|nr:type II toxin-antitoxin system HipA family toxin [Legionella pneumophila]HEI6763043.1 type II toxin-antitoxin system HipA family toxin [Legionella pneumophila]